MRNLLQKSIFAWLLLLTVCFGSDELPINLEYSDFFEIVRGFEKDTIYITGSTRFSHGDGKLFADSAIWIKGETIVLKGNVLIQDSLYRLTADKVDYNIIKRLSYAVGDEVIIISEKDSIKAVGPNAYFSRDSSLFRMKGRPTLTLNYPDTSRLINIIADFIAFESVSEIGYADGDVKIIQMDTEAESRRAIMYSNKNILLMLDSTIAKRKESEITGDTLIFFSDDKELNKLLAQGNAKGHFKEPSKEDSTQFDLSDLKAKEIEFNFKYGQLDNIKAAGQAYSYYNPALLDSTKVEENHISGDSISLFLKNDELSSIEVIGGAEGQYLMGEYKYDDSGQNYIEDTVFYASDSIYYLPDDSTISLKHNASVNDAKVSLTAATINYNTANQVVTAYDDTTLFNDSTEIYVPVLLKDGSEELIGAYLEYSMDTEKGMIWNSSSEFQDAYYKGKELFREEEDVFYIKNGIYTSCDHDPPHFHFWSHKMKIIKDDRAMARPVMLFIGKIPIPPVPLPYYIFPLKKGRHSGILPFKFGNFNRGGRFIRNVGYYWAASDYFDALASFDYNEEYGISYNAAFKYNLRYKFSGSISGSYVNESHYDQFSYNQIKGKRWSLRFNHSHTVSPTFSIRANGNFISDKRYYTDYSLDEEDRLNRSLNSQLSFSKRFGNVSLSGQFKHNDEIDKETRTDLLPTMAISFPSRPIFGTPPKDGEGKSLKKWYHGFYSGYSVNFSNYSLRKTITVITDTDTTDNVADTTVFKSRKEYMTVKHKTGLSAPFKIFSYFKLNPSFSYSESWVKILPTDQSDSLGFNTSTGYRRYQYRAGVSASTDLYGTINPKIFMLEGLRHVLTPSVSYSWTPELKRHEDEMIYAGAGGGSNKSKSMSFGLRQLFQAKIKSGESSSKLDLLTINSSCSYNFEATGKKFGTLSTSAQTSLLKNIRVSASWRHDLYIPGTENLHWWSPYLLSFSLSTTFRTGGILGQYERSDENDNTENPQGKTNGEGSLKQGWDFSLTHHYNESGRGELFRKTHTINFNLNVTLTPNLNIGYRQYYDFGRSKTISRSLNIVRKLHCWEGHFSWVIDGSNSGFQFRLNVISIPEIKYEKVRNWH
ncbi:MAG: LPS assembly protein LptD [candidate division Zixibacteria bacterium]|nr:LPS assembly protein LptD [candidate division Zixibacteria bacterium]